MPTTYFQTIHPSRQTELLLSPYIQEMLAQQNLKHVLIVTATVIAWYSVFAVDSANIPPLGDSLVYQTPWPAPINVTYKKQQTNDSKPKHQC